MPACRGRKSVHEYLSVYIEICVIIDSSRAFIYVLLIKTNVIASIAI